MKYDITRPVALILLPFFLAGCGTTSAPTESSTKTFDKTTNSTTDTTSSSTPDKSSSTARAERFTQENFAQVKTDMATGGGEHLAALAMLLEVPLDQEERFFFLSKERYAALYGTPNTTAGLMLTRLRGAMDADSQLKR